MAEQQACELAKRDRWYGARCIRGEWCVWCLKADHEVEFEDVRGRQ